MRLANNNRTDDNQAEIIDALEKAGATVISLGKIGDGCPDILIGFRNINILAEIKNPQTKGRLNTKQEYWHKWWRGQRAVITTPEEGLSIIGITL